MQLELLGTNVLGIVGVLVHCWLEGINLMGVCRSVELGEKLLGKIWTTKDLFFWQGEVMRATIELRNFCWQGEISRKQTSLLEVRICSRMQPKVWGVEHHCWK
jgi:hypothetical protein